MDISKLYYLKHWLEYSSFSFNLENYAILTNSLLLLQNENHFKKIFFWGIIYGLEADYYISFGYKTDAVLDRIFFYRYGKSCGFTKAIILYILYLNNYLRVRSPQASKGPAQAM